MILAIILMLLGWRADRLVYAEDNSPPGPDRNTVILTDTTRYLWWLVYWSDNSVACSFSIDHEGKPTKTEVYDRCGEKIYQQWQKTQTCEKNGDSIIYKTCTGMYLHFIGTETIDAEEGITLPLPAVWINIAGCAFEGNTNRCAGTPSLHFLGEEPLPNETIMQIEGTIDGEPFSCGQEECTVPLKTTTEKGVLVTFWGNSSYGDSTILYEALVRVIPNNQQPIYQISNPSDPKYFVDVLSSQWMGSVEYSDCALTWKAFPDLEGSPAWLSSPADPSGLYTDEPYYYLAGMLINRGLVDVSQCGGSGMENEIAANECGMQLASSKAVEWQNQFNDQIFQASGEAGIPAQLLKNLFARESQFWPGSLIESNETGLGQLTEKGADAALLWNPEFYVEFCPQVLSANTCALGYGNLSEQQVSMLRGALVRKVNAICPDCPLGIDLTAANESIAVFSELLAGNCNQVNQIVANVTNNSNAGSLSSYDDLWRFVLVNYNAGSGCLFNALKRTWETNQPLDWMHVATNFDIVCQKTVDYVTSISEGNTTKITAFSTMLPTPTYFTPTPTKTPTFTRTPTLTRTPTITTTATTTLTPTVTQTPTDTPTPTLTATPTVTETTSVAPPLDPTEPP